MVKQIVVKNLQYLASFSVGSIFGYVGSKSIKTK
jgi:hypothetical protein